MSTSKLYQTINGELLMSTEALALVLGVTVEDIERSRRRQNNPPAWTPPAEWVRQGRRIVREAQAAIGSTDMTAVIDHLAATR